MEGSSETERLTENSPEDSSAVTMPEIECRICREGATEAELWKPCDCKYQGVHLKCLEMWISQRGGEYGSELKCEVRAAEVPGVPPSPVKAAGVSR